MGKKMNPIWMRVGIVKSWSSEWFAKNKKQTREFFLEDNKVRKIVDDYYKRSWIAKVVIRKTEKDNEIIIFTAKPAWIVWKEWSKLAKFQETLKKSVKNNYNVNVKEIKNPELSARIMAEFAAEQLEKRLPFRKVAMWVISRVMEKWALWVKVWVAWRLNWVDISRSEKFQQWRIPLQTIRSDIDYHYTTASTKYWVLWVKVWIYKGEIYEKKNSNNNHH